MDTMDELRERFSELSPFLICLGDEKRQQIILRLMEEKDCSGLQVTDLMETIELSRPAVSHHLKVLKQAKIVKFRSEGTKNFYFLTHEIGEINKLKRLLDQLTNFMEKG
ncbi:transcriptional regulator [Enterococcus sp. JM4C]|uniref:ArsR/SmtB family transcription factor n=1 Tax=Candidatus Enterococcus huntleyi TaxID=1857217 RepID=UPI00137A85C9|nr:metalloregulator ArsR/SmtB family transcription factor [Enterococcus sp. JM4C]KAF1298595.1 transcriptional regulator [Enterococcus sp. JM4C]